WGFKNSIFYQDLWEDIKNQLALNKGNPSLANDLNDTLTAAVAGHYLKQRTAMQDDSHKYINGLVEEAIKGHSANPAMAGSLLETGVLYDVAHIINQATRYQPIDGQNPTDLTTDLLRACKTKAPFLNENCVDALDRLTSAVKDDEKLLGNLNNSIVGLRAQLMQIKDAITHIENQSPVIRRLEELHQQISNFALYNCDSASQSQKPCYMGAISNFDDDATINLLRIGDNLMGTFAFDDKSKNYTREKFNLFCKNLAKEELEFVKPACQQSKMFTTYDKYFNAHSWFSLNRGYYIDRDPITGKIFNMEKRPTAWAFLPKAIGNSLNDRLWASFMTGYIWSPTMINAAREVGFMQKEFNAQNEAVNNYVKATWDNAIQDAANYNSYLYNQYMMGAVSPNQVFSNLGQLTPDAVIGTGI
ncbi:MAG: hypothetical protein J6Y94_07145, partial [Bacteriovoracaceae bacterium]|nr:hypothetical protein [Bacteriovoracaceae bacterium]